MYVVKRDGRREQVQFDKITARMKKLCYGCTRTWIPVSVAMRVIEGVYDGVTTSELDNLAAEVAATNAVNHPDYAQLASRIAVSNLHKTTKKSFTEVMRDLHTYKDPMTGENASLVADDVMEIIEANSEELDSAIIYDRDFSYDYFGFKTLERSYLLKLDGEVAERPQQMLMRVSVGIHKDDIESAIKTYNLMSEGWFTHATPTLFNAGTPKPQMSSCFLLTMQEDSISGIYDTLKQCAKISQNAGGIGLAIHDIRATGSYIRGTNGTSNGIVPMLRVFNDTARYVDQGGGKRKGSFAVYLEPWHADVFDFLDLKKNHGKEEQRARDLFYALWTPDLFMKRVEEDGDWTLLCPNECPGLTDSWGAGVRGAVREVRGRGQAARKTIKAQRALVQDPRERRSRRARRTCCTRTPPTASPTSRTSAPSAAPTCAPRSSSTPRPTRSPVCNLASHRAAAFVTEAAPSTTTAVRGDVHQVTKNLNRVIDRNYYPVPEARNSNMRHRPVGIGVQGLADVFILMRSSRSIRRRPASSTRTSSRPSTTPRSARRATREGRRAYESFPGSPASGGHPAARHVGRHAERTAGSGRPARAEIMEHGLRNSLLAPMPTATTAQILGNNECFEPYTSNIYTRRTLSGEFIVVNKHLLRDLTKLGLWNEDMKNQLIAANGSRAEHPEHPREPQGALPHRMGDLPARASSTWPPTAAPSSTSPSR